MTPPDELRQLRERLAETTDLQALGALMFWDQNTMMPPGGAAARADMADTLQRTLHARETDPGLGRLLDALEPWAAGEDPDSEGARLVHWARRDFEKSVRVPADLAAQLTRAKAEGLQAWMEALAAADFCRLRAALERHVELRHAYVELLRGLRAPLRRAARRLRARPDHRRAAADVRRAARGARPARRRRRRPRAAAQRRRLPRRRSASTTQRAAVLELLDAVGYDPDHWRLDPSLHPFAQSLAPTDVRLTTKYDEHDYAVALYSVLHEFGHGLYEASVDPRAVPDLAGRAGVARRARVPEPAVGERRRALAPVLRVSAARAAPPVPRLLHRPRRRRPLPRRQHGPAVADPDRGRRDDLQPPHHPALRARAGADGGDAGRGRRCPRPGTSRSSGCSGSRSPTTPRACSRTPTGAPG